MIDTHIHVVPGVDDGAKDMATAIEMLKLANDHGTDAMILTPHYNRGKYDNIGVKEAFDRLVEVKNKEQVGVDLYLGNEVYLNEENVEGVMEGHGFSMADTRYVLVELPFFQFYPFHENLIHELQLKGYKVIIAHIERYEYLHTKKDLLKSLIERGAYGQLSAKHLLTWRNRRQAMKWIKEGKVHIIASDGHGVNHRRPLMDTAYTHVSRKIGKEKADLLFTGNPGNIIKDKALDSV